MPARVETPPPLFDTTRSPAAVMLPRVRLELDALTLKSPPDVPESAPLMLAGLPVWAMDTAPLAAFMVTVEADRLPAPVTVTPAAFCTVRTPPVFDAEMLPVLEIVGV